MTEQQLQARKTRNIKRYWAFIKHMLKVNPPATHGFNQQKRVINGVFYDAHHIIPQELGGTNAAWNLVMLPASQAPSDGVPECHQPSEVAWPPPPGLQSRCSAPLSAAAAGLGRPVFPPSRMRVTLLT